MSIVGELLQRWRLRADSRPAGAAPGREEAEPTGAAVTDPPVAATPAPESGATELCRLCGQPLRDDDVVAVHAADVVHSDCYDESLSRDPRSLTPPSGRR